jgi:hypothetical protein
MAGRNAMATAGKSRGAASSKKQPPGSRKAGATVPAADQIAVRAYQIWVANGCPQGRDTEHWLQAERELTGKAR